MKINFVFFFYIINHGVSKDLQKRVFQAIQDFFALPLLEKRAIDIKKSGVKWKRCVDKGLEATNINLISFYMGFAGLLGHVRSHALSR